MVYFTRCQKIIIFFSFTAIICLMLIIPKYVPHPGLGKLLKKLELRSNENICEIKPFNYSGRHQEDPELMKYISTLFVPPSVHLYNLRYPERLIWTFPEQVQAVVDIFGPERRDGFFVEVGGFEGEHGSISLYLERVYGFRGVLIEANPENYKSILSKNRKIYVLEAALAPTNYSGDIYFRGAGQTGKLVDKGTPSSFKVRSFPIYSILRGLNLTFIDFMILDVEGFDFKVMKTIPWDKLRFGIFIMEHLNIPEPKDDVLKFMEAKGYVKIFANGYDYGWVDPAYRKKIQDARTTTTSTTTTTTTKTPPKTTPTAAKG